MLEKKIYVLISPDAMQATLQCSAQAGELINLTEQDLQNALLAAGVQLPVRPETLKETLRAAKAGQNISGTVLVEGLAPRPAKPGIFIPAGNLSLPVFPGDCIGHLEAAVPAKDGFNVLGEAVPAPLSASLENMHTVKCADSKMLFQDDNKIFALRYGLVLVENNLVQLRPLLSFSEDLMSLYATLYNRNFQGNPITLKQLGQALVALKIKVKPDVTFLQKKLEEANRSNEPLVDVLICKGLAPEKGKDGWLEVFLLQDEKKAGAIDESGNIDYRERGEIKTANEGDVIAIVHPPEKGTPGRDLLGNTLPGEDGDPARVILKENVKFSQDGGKIIALCGGLVLYDAPEIRISEIYVLNGDVDLHSGHLAIERGSALIQGSVLAGFNVSCPGTILVRKTVEAANLTSGADIEISRGIVMDGHAVISALGNISAAFAINAHIRAGKNVYIANEASKCNIVAKECVIVSGGNGKIQGGTIRAGREIQANTIGTSLHIPTNIHLGLEESVLSEEAKERTLLEETLQFLNHKLEHKNDAEAMAGTPKERQPAMVQLLEMRKYLQERINELAKIINSLTNPSATQKGYVLKVTGTIYPGTTVYCENVQLPIHSPLSACKILFDPFARQLRVVPL